MIITLTPFPSMEYIYTMDAFLPKQVNPYKEVALNILSKGVYSAQIMKVLQEEPIIISSVGGFVGKSIKHYIDKAKIKSDIAWSEHETPHQVKIILNKEAEYYILKNQEDFLPNKEFAMLSYKLKNHLKKVSTLVISGSLLTNQAIPMYSEWITEAKRHNIKTVVCIGEKSVWDIVKHNKPYALLFTSNQLKALNINLNTYEEMIHFFKPYLGEGLHYICIFTKNKGALILSKHKYCLVQAPLYYININNTASSGAFLGALAVGINRKYEQEKIAKLCLAAAIAAEDNIKHKICTRKDIEYYYKKTKITQIVL